MLTREKLLNYGGDSLSDLELISMIIGGGKSQILSSDVAIKILAIIKLKNKDLSLEDLRPITQISKVKACQLMASLELGRRHSLKFGKKISSASDLIPYLMIYVDKKQEHFISISLNGANEIIEIRVVSIGLVNCTQVHPREVFADPLVDRACSLIVAHNHPSGNLQPSPEDLKVTKRLQEAAALLGIKLLDHIIFAQTGFYSFAEDGRMSA